MPNTIYRVTLDQTMYGQQLQNVLHFIHPSSDPATLQLLADEVEASWINNIRLRMTGSVRFSRIRVRMLESQFATFEKVINITGAFGAHSEMDTFNAVIIRLRTALHGKRGRGRLYIPGVLPGWTTDGFLKVDQVTNWNLRLSIMMGVFGPGGSSLARLAVCPSRPPFNAVEVNNMQVAPTLGIQRRRNIGVGL